MDKGIIYLMEATAVEGIVKIGKTECNQFESRMRLLERDGYRCQQLKRVFAIEVDDYNNKEILLHDIFEKSRIGDSELFALNKGLAIQLLSSLKGNVIYPKQDQNVIFEKATEDVIASKDYDESFHLNKMSSEVRDLYLKLKQFVISKYPDLTLRYKKLYISFLKDGEIVCDVEIANKKSLFIYIDIRNESISDPNNITQNVSEIGHHGNGDYRVNISDTSKFDSLLDLIKQSYDKK